MTSRIRTQGTQGVFCNIPRINSDQRGNEEISIRTKQKGNMEAIFSFMLHGSIFRCSYTRVQRNFAAPLPPIWSILEKYLILGLSFSVVALENKLYLQIQIFFFFVSNALYWRKWEANNTVLHIFIGPLIFFLTIRQRQTFYSFLSLSSLPLKLSHKMQKFGQLLLFFVCLFNI